MKIETWQWWTERTNLLLRKIKWGFDQTRYYKGKLCFWVGHLKLTILGSNRGAKEINALKVGTNYLFRRKTLKPWREIQ